MSDYVRKTKEDRPVVAICYDFDKTLSPDDMQAQGYIQSVGYEVDKFWEKSNELASQNGMDSNLAYMYLMMEEARGTLVFNRKALEDYGSRVQLFPGAVQQSGHHLLHRGLLHRPFRGRLLPSGMRLHRYRNRYTWR